MRKIILLGFVSFCFLGSIWAQPANGNTPAALIKSGDEQIEKGQYYNALEQYEKSYKEVKDKDVAVKIARTHFLLRDYGKSATKFAQVLARDKANKYIEERFLYGKALKMNAQYTEAAAEFNNYIANGTNMELKAQAEIELKGIELLGTMKENVAIIVKNAGNQVNNPESQSSPSLDSEGKLYFGSLDAKETKENGGVHFCKLYSSTFTEGKGWSKAEEMPELINREGYHTSNVSFSKDGNMMFFTRTLSEGGHMDESKIFASTKTASDWSPALEVTGVNGEFMARHPVEGDLFGNRVLFFSSNIPGGKGGFDIYYANKMSETEYSAPINAGSINTAADELTPYYVDGKLYFSSEGWPGIGGLDIFVSNWNGSEWSVPTNMGLPYNSCTDDIYYKIAADGEKGFLVSNRADPESKSLKGKTCCDDIYTVTKRKLVIELNAFAKDEKNKSIKGIVAQLVELNVGTDGNIQTKSNQEGNQVSYSLSKDKAYKIVVSKDGYFPAEIQLNTVGITQDQVLNRDFVLKMMPPESDVEIITINEPIRLSNIYYNYDDDKILPDAEKDLNAILELMVKYPEMVIELGSHTDSRGDDDYNQKLSLRRANSARRWLINKGIDSKRIQAKGYGETVILNNCSNGEDCTDDEHRFNRRTEFKILEGPTSIEVRKEVLNKKGKASKK
ncbi:MAG: OmpA family protein [Saprospiraceae bacterium]|uniref:OmpA family protein n=1 Tax=Candidatus Defluviibacterium haderslevense TaxID=2981993 RepID=A0A9D7S7S3_9BACT|nr:OmpA family protein [Candidatus Defluviibacterium haderslevense]MBK7242664.1 OmpA family protein [Candidatus Defluviibacterium haderslevense]MBK9716707.1 OmpA family protein [Candidatus Defluviibacterium haderslevense]MBL0235941.1 OmpA family protein [Candidatus Defluviibacterium haderslevense]